MSFTITIWYFFSNNYNTLSRIDETKIQLNHCDYCIHYASKCDFLPISQYLIEIQTAGIDIKEEIDIPGVEYLIFKSSNGNRNIL